MYVDPNSDPLPPLTVERGVAEQVPLVYAGEFRYLDIQGNDLTAVEKVLELPETVQAPVQEGTEAGRARYLLNGIEIGSMPVLFAEDVEKAVYGDYLKRVFGLFLL